MQRDDIASLSVRRPILALVLNLLIILAGIAALLGVQVRELPEVDRPVITVRTTYDGATPESVDSQVTGIIEGAVSRVPGLVSISSSSGYGWSRVVLEFSDSTDLNVAASDARDAVNSIRGRLPDDAEEPLVVKADSDGDAVMRLSVTSTTLPAEELTRLVEDRVVDRLAAVEGVADVQVYGEQEPILRVTVDPTALAARGLTLDDLASTLGTVSLDAPAGELRGGQQTLIVRAGLGAVTEEEIAATLLDRTTRLSDVARVEIVPDERSTVLRANGRAGIGIGIIRQAKSNTLNISTDVRRAVAELRTLLPSGVDLSVRSDDAVFIGGAVREVTITLFLATAIVVGIIFVFLNSARATLIPAVAVPVALIGTVAAIWLAGFSLNILTLLALVLATGIVVDDAIVVLENVERRRAEGFGPRAAAVLGTRQVFFAVIATTATLAAVFVPISFFPGTAGRLFREFGFVLAISVAISSVVALTLCPMLASRILPGQADPGAPTARPGMLARIGGAGARLYATMLEGCLRAPLAVLCGAALFALAALGIFRALPEELTPREDRGLLLLSVSAPAGAGLSYTEAKVREIEDIVGRIIETGEATDLFSIIGNGGSNRAFIIVSLAPWSERERSQREISAELDRALSGVIGVQISARTPNSLGIRGGGSGLQFAVTGSDYDALVVASEALVAEMRARLTTVRNPALAYDTTQPQLTVKVDRARAGDLGISAEGVSIALQTMLDGRRIGDLFRDDQALPIIMRAPEGTIDDPSDLENLFVKAREGGLVPLSSVATLTETAVAPTLRREGQRRAVPVAASLAPEADMRSAMAEVTDLAAEVLPPGMGIRFLGTAATLDETSNSVAITFAFALLIVLFVLAAQFESFVSAIVIMATVPFGLGAAAFAIQLTGGSLNIYSQIGLVMLVGLMAKNGILIVEFANQLRDRGLAVGNAIREACAVRLRPVMMTMISTILGGLPLALTTGPGAEARQALGWLIVGGLGFSTLFTLFLTPVAYLLLARLSKPRAHEQAQLALELETAAAPGARLPSEDRTPATGAVP